MSFKFKIKALHDASITNSIYTFENMSIGWTTNKFIVIKNLYVKSLDTYPSYTYYIDQRRKTFKRYNCKSIDFIADTLVVGKKNAINFKNMSITRNSNSFGSYTEAEYEEYE